MHERQPFRDIHLPGAGHPAPRSRRRAWCLLALTPALFGCESADPLDQRAHERVETSSPEVAVSWGGLAYHLAWTEDEFLTFKGQRALAMTHLAMHDALQAVVPIHASYAYEAHEPDASPEAAASQAAYEILLAAYPDRRAELDEARAAWLDRVPEGEPKERGIRVGTASAEALLARRADDGWDHPGTYAFRDGPGQYRTTPPWDGFALQPGFGAARPFSFTDPARFRPEPPPALDSPEYAAALEEVRLQGDSASTSRTDEQTGYAVWWMEFAEGSVGRLARRLVTEQGLDLWEANRVLARLYVALYDGYVANWESKYEYNHWRPYTAVRAAGDDGNPGTEGDPDWVPLRPTPPFPEYASAHATGCAAAFEILDDAFGHELHFELTTLTAPDGMPARAFGSFAEAAEECADSRIRLGWHFRYATDAGLEAGRQVARHVLSTMLVGR